MALPPSPDKESELERRLAEIKEEEESLAVAHRELLAAFANTTRSNALDWNEFQAQEVDSRAHAHVRARAHTRTQKKHFRVPSCMHAHIKLSCACASCPVHVYTNMSFLAYSGVFAAAYGVSKET
jgi:hypothetical protein